MSGRRKKPKASGAIAIHYGDGETASAVSAAVLPDNIHVPQGIRVGTRAEGKILRLSVQCSRGIGSLVATLDDLLSCVQAAERAISGVRPMDRPG